MKGKEPYGTKEKPSILGRNSRFPSLPLPSVGRSSIGVTIDASTFTCTCVCPKYISTYIPSVVKTHTKNHTHTHTHTSPHSRRPSRSLKFRESIGPRPSTRRPALSHCHDFANSKEKTQTCGEGLTDKRVRVLRERRERREEHWGREGEREKQNGLRVKDFKSEISVFLIEKCLKSSHVLLSDLKDETSRKI